MWGGRLRGGDRDVAFLFALKCSGEYKVKLRRFSPEFSRVTSERQIGHELRTYGARPPKQILSSSEPVHATSAFQSERGKWDHLHLKFELTKLLNSMLGPVVNRQPGFRRRTRRAKQHGEEQPRWLGGWLTGWLAR